MQHVITITSTEYDSQISRYTGEKDQKQKKCQVVILKKESHAYLSCSFLTPR